MRRISLIASRPVDSMFSSAPTAWSGSAAHLPSRRPGLDDHHAQAVGHDVVQLAGDAGALLLHLLHGQQLALALGPLGPLDELVGPLSTAAHVVAEQDRRQRRARRC